MQDTPLQGIKVLDLTQIYQGPYASFLMAMAGAGAITHSMGPPTPGPLMIAVGLKLDLGVAMMAGLVASLLPAILVLRMAAWFDKKYDLPMRDVAGTSSEELKSIVNKKDEELPPLFLSALPIAFPVVVISAVSVSPGSFVLGSRPETAGPRCAAVTRRAGPPPSDR